MSGKCDESCNSCQATCTASCNSCNSCNAPCNTCQGECNSCESFCENGYQYVNQHFNNFDFGECVSSGQVFISADAWGSLVDYVQNVYKKGDESHPTVPSLVKPKSGDYMTAAMYNKMVDALNGLGSTSSILRNDMQPQIDEILGVYFSNIEDYIADEWKLKNSQCDNCNANCNVTCNNCEASCNNSCEGCLSCNGSCNRCMGCDSSCDVCDNCDTCEGCYSHVEPEG